MPAPRTVRYAWAGIPDANLSNKSGLPAAPFRTDQSPPADVEIQAQLRSRTLTTSAYEIAINADGKVTSLGVRGKQFLSNAIGHAGGTSIPVWLGARSLNRIQELGPDLLSCSDDQCTLLLAFKADSMEWNVTNRGKDPINFRIALASLVSIADQGNGVFIASRGKTRLRVEGIDVVNNADDGKMLEVVVKGGATRNLKLVVAR